MTRVLLGAVLLGNLGICVIAQVPVMLPPPTQVKFDSVDYKNILHWTPPINSTSLQYDVQWKIYGEPQWMDVNRCQEIQKHQCDLSTVTSDLREWYYARVRAFSSVSSSKSAWATSPRFSPRWDTKISPPLLKLNITDQGIVVRVKPPRLLVHKMHSSVHYKIYLMHTGREEVFEMDCCSNKLSLKELDHNIQYCLQAQTVILVQAKSSPRSSVKCVTFL
ncbi:interleukin-22 receptor subunit alpha-2 isoform X2 [Channa argus]|uniref:interleukin-22 receptor subunit alpha-2 isoform X2 n=1 Tax=Channa argus TaxID=215402 RepID=UPI0035221368